MMSRAQQLIKQKPLIKYEGVDQCIGDIETHAEKDTQPDQFVAGRQTMNYRGAILFCHRPCIEWTVSIL
jgi:hypothetical protein